MDELRRNHIVRLVLKSGEYVEGEVIDYSPDRVMILIFPYCFDLAKKIKELDELKVIVHTHLGLKEMNSSVISEFNSINCITIENNPTIPVEQKRAFVRVMADIDFKLFKNDVLYNCKCINISAGGVAFMLNDSSVQVGDVVTLSFDKSYFEKDIMTSAKIIKNDNNWFVAQYINLPPRDEDKIVKYVFGQIVKLN